MTTIVFPSNTNSGIYQIINKTTGDSYIGSSKELKRRKQLHFSDLRCNRHINRHLQFAWNKYGEDSFSFKTLITCSQDMLLWYEQQFLDQLSPRYNILLTAYSPVGYKHTDEAKKKISLALLGKKKPDGFSDLVSNRCKGKKFSEKHKRSLSLAAMGRVHRDISEVTFIDPLGNFYTEESITKFSIKNNLDPSSVCKLLSGKLKSTKGWRIQDGNSLSRWN